MPSKERPRFHADRLFSDAVKRARESRGWSLGRMATECHARGYPTSSPAIWKIENGARTVSLGEALAIADALDMELSDLLAE